MTPWLVTKTAGRADWQIPMLPEHGQDILDDLKRKAQAGYPAIGPASFFITSSFSQPVKALTEEVSALASDTTR